MKVFTIENLGGEVKTCHAKDCVCWLFKLVSGSPVCILCNYPYDIEEGEFYGEIRGKGELE